MFKKSGIVLQNIIFTLVVLIYSRSSSLSLKVGLTCLFKKKSHFTVYTQLLFWNVPYSNLHINCIKRCFQNKILWQTELSCDTFIWFVLLLHRVDWIQAEQKQAVTAASWIFVPNFSPLKSCKLKWVVLQLHFFFLFSKIFHWRLCGFQPK